MYTLGEITAAVMLWNGSLGFVYFVTDGMF